MTNLYKIQKEQKGWYWLIPLLPADMGITRGVMVFRKFHRGGSFRHDFCNEAGKVNSRGKCTKVKENTQSVWWKAKCRGWCGETTDHREGSSSIRKNHEWLCKGLMGEKTNQPFWWWECNLSKAVVDDWSGLRQALRQRAVKGLLQ